MLMLHSVPSIHIPGTFHGYEAIRDTPIRDTPIKEKETKLKEEEDRF